MPMPFEDQQQQQDQQLQDDQQYQDQQQQYNPYMQQQGIGQEVHLFRLSNKEVLDDIQHQLRGEVIENSKWVAKHTPWANDAFISQAMGILIAAGLNKNTTLGILEPSQVDLRCLAIYRELMLMISINQYKYGIQKGTRSMICQLIIQPIHSALSRSLYGKEGKQISSTTQHLEHTVREDKPRQLPFFNRARAISRREL